MKKRSITIRITDDLRDALYSISKDKKAPVSDLVRESIRKYVSLYQFRKLRRQVLPFAEAQGILTDDDVLQGLRK